MRATESAVHSVLVHSVWKPRATSCPAPVSPSCNGSNVFTNGWCPFSVPGTTDVYCARNASSSISPTGGTRDIPRAYLKLTGTAAGFQRKRGRRNRYLSRLAYLGASGTTIFTDLGSQWGRGGI